jgi:flavin-dependent dehydrogenase
MVALLLAERGLRVALIDRASFPRPKVCGSCLNGAAVSYLEEVGLGDFPVRAGAPRLRLLRLLGHGRQAVVPLDSGFAVSREALDSALVDAARSRGAVFLASTTATLGELRGDAWELDLRSREGTRTLRAAVVIGADGLGGSFLARHPAYASRVAGRSKVGLGLHIHAPSAALEDGEIRMILFPGGYAGLVRLENGLVDLAAAVTPGVLAAQSVDSLLQGIVNEAGIRDFDVVTRLRGTPPLTRHRPVVAGTRLFMLGDAAVYVEPFTGEGIAWAMGSARLLAPLAEAACRGWHPALADAWNRRLREGLGSRYRFSRWVAVALDHPVICRSLLAVLGRVPGVTGPVLANLNRPLSERVV